MGSKYRKQIEKFLEGRGYVRGEHDVRKSLTTWHRAFRPDVKVYDGIAEHAVRAIIREIDKIDGVKSIKAVRKRNVSAIKDRQRAERERLAAERDRHILELRDYERRMDERLKSMTNAEWAAVCAEIERREREIREIERLMTALPDTGHRGVEHAKHRA